MFSSSAVMVGLPMRVYMYPFSVPAKHAAPCSAFLKEKVEEIDIWEQILPQMDHQPSLHGSGGESNLRSLFCIMNKFLDHDKFGPSSTFAKLEKIERKSQGIGIVI